MGGDPALRSEPPLAVSVLVKQSDTAFDVVIETRQGAGLFRRQFLSESCTEAVEATALILGLAIDPELKVPQEVDAGEPPAAEQPPVAEQPPAAVLAPPVKRPARPQPASQVRSRPLRFDVREPKGGVDRARRWSVAASGLLAGGVLPAASFGTELGAGFDWGPATFGARGFWLAPSRVVFSDSQNVGADIGAWGGVLQGGARWLSVGPLQASAHGSLWYALQVADAIGTPDRNQGTRGWLAATAGATCSLQVAASISLFLRGDAGAALARPRFLIENSELFQSSTLVGGGALGSRFHF